MINIFSYSLKKTIANNNIADIEIEKTLIIAYRYDDFKKTNLYKKLLIWQDENSVKLLK